MINKWRLSGINKLAKVKKVIYNNGSSNYKVDLILTIY